jgi:hypothetical protein
MSMPMHLQELDRVADLVRSQDPSLDTLWLEPDGTYQTRRMTLDAAMRETTQCLAAGFRRLRPEQFPVLYCGWGKARVGSTALTNLFGLAGMPSYYQPLKAMARLVLVGAAATPWVLPSADEHPHLFSKETAGPYMPWECLFIPLRLLIEAGYPASKLHLLVLDREPAGSLSSWLRKLSHRVPAEILVRHYVIAALNAVRVKSYARRHGVPVTHYVYEASKDPVRAVRALFARLGLAHRFSEAAVTDWRETGRLASEDSRIIYPDEPGIYQVPGLHASDTAYHYRDGGGELTDEQLRLLARSGVFDVYRESVEGCASELGLDVTVPAMPFGGGRIASAA